MSNPTPEAPPSQTTRSLVWRRAVRPLLFVASLYAGFLAGERLGVLKGLYQVIETQLPVVVEIGLAVRELPAITGRLLSALERAPAPCPSAGRVTLTLQKDTLPMKVRTGTDWGSLPAWDRRAGKSHPSSWSNDPFEGQ